MRKLGIFLGVSPRFGGMFQYAQSMLDALAALPKNEYSVMVAYANPLWREHLTHYSFEVLPMPGGKSGLVMAYLLMAAQVPASLCRYVSRYLNPSTRALDRAGCDLWLFPGQDSISYQLRTPTLVSIHDLMHRYEPGFPEVSGFGRYRIREQRFSSIVRSASGILVDSDTGRQQVVESYGAEASRVYPLPYVAPRRDEEQAPGRDFDGQYRLPRKFLFYPAQFWAHKNHLRLIEALSLMRVEHPDVCLVLCGARKTEYGKVAKRVEMLGLKDNVIFTGYVPDSDIPEFYRRARALIMPTFFGPTNIPPLEAFAFGCPVATSNVYGMPAQIGDAGLLFDPASVSEMRDCMSNLWRDDALCQRLRERGLARAKAWGPPAFNAAFQRILDGI